MSISTRNICVHTVHGTKWNMERNGTVVHEAKWGNMEEAAFKSAPAKVRDETPCLVSSRLASPGPSVRILYLYLPKRAPPVPDDNASLALPVLRTGFKEEIGGARRSLYLPPGNVHSRYAAAAMARSARTPAKNTKCKTCSAICLPLCGERRYKFRRA